MDLEAVKQFFESNKENADVKGYLDGLSKPTLEGIQKLVSDDQDFKKWFDSEKDKHFNKGLSTWMEKTFPSKLEEEIKKRNPELTPEQKRIRELELKFEEQEKATQREAIKVKALAAATEQKIPTSMVGLLSADDEKTTMDNLSKFAEAMKSYVDAQVEERLKEGNYTPPKDKKKGSETSTGSFMDAIKQNQVRR